MKTIFYITIISILCISCSKDNLHADGNITTEVRLPGNFTGVHSSGSNPINISYGNEYRVELRGSANLIARYETNIHNGVLELGYEFVRVRNDDVEVFVTMPLIRSAGMSGSGRLTISGDFPPQDLFRLSISGSSKTQVKDTFNADAVHVEISGSGDADLGKILARKGDIRISGSSDLRLNVSDFLKVRISGSGKVYYTGNPTLDSEISGSGRLIKF